LFVEEIDGIDNGVEQHVDGTKRYNITSNLSMRMRLLHPKAWEFLPPGEDGMNARFWEAVNLCAAEFCMSLFAVLHELKQKGIVETAMYNAGCTHKSLEIIALAEFTPWQNHVYELERKYSIKIKFCLYPDKAGWKVQAVGDGTKFGKRLPLHWSGLSNEELCEASGIKGCIFVHPNAFIGGNKTYEGALEMAIKSLISLKI